MPGKNAELLVFKKSLIINTKVVNSDMYIQLQPTESNLKFSPSYSVF